MRLSRFYDGRRILANMQKLYAYCIILVSALKSPVSPHMSPVSGIASSVASLAHTGLESPLTGLVSGLTGLMSTLTGLVSTHITSVCWPTNSAHPGSGRKNYCPGRAECAESLAAPIACIKRLSVGQREACLAWGPSRPTPPSFRVLGLPVDAFGLPRSPFRVFRAPG